MPQIVYVCVVCLQGKGNMTTYWLNGVEEEDGEQADDEAGDSDSDVESDADLPEVQDRGDTANSGGKISVADSGIGCDKPVDSEDKGNGLEDNDLPSNKDNGPEALHIFGKKKFRFEDELENGGDATGHPSPAPPLGPADTSLPGPPFKQPPRVFATNFTKGQSSWYNQAD